MQPDEATPESDTAQEPQQLDFKFSPVEIVPPRKYRKGSKYDPLLDEFKKSKNSLVEVHVEGKNANYLRTQLAKRIDARKLKNVKVSVTNNVCYLSKK